MVTISQWWRLLVSPLLPSFQLLVHSQDAGTSLVVLTDQETTEVLPVELLKPPINTNRHIKYITGTS